MPKNLFTSLMRTGVPISVGLVLALAARVGLDLDSADAALVVGSALTAGYYAVFRLLEELAERIGVPWLRATAGVALGWARPPQYVAPVTAPVRLKLDMKGTEEEFVRALRRAGQARGI